MKKPSFWAALGRMALMMLAAFAVMLLLVRGKAAMALIFSAMPLTSLLEAWLFRPLMGVVESPHRLDAALWLLIVVAYVQWTLLGALLAHGWQVLRYRRAKLLTEAE